MPTLRLYDRSGGHRDHWFADELTIGRSPDVSLSLRDPNLARRHARVERRGDAYVLVDHDSTGGLTIAGRRVDEHPLRDGERFTIAGRDLCFLAEPLVPPLAPPPAVARMHRVDGTSADFLIGPGREIVGDHPRVAVRLPGGEPRHARIVALGGAYWIEALDGPVYRGGAPVERAELRFGECVELGRDRLELCPPDPARLRVYTGDDPRRFVDHPLGRRTRIGSREDSDLVLRREDGVSRDHCRIDRDRDAFVIDDLASTNGLVVNGEKASRHPLHHGDRVQLGQTVCVFLAEPDRPTPGLTALRTTLAQAELAQPPIPALFWPLLQTFRPWWFGTRKTDGLYQYAGLLHAEADRADVPDYVIVGHAGHGMNSYALHYFLRHGPLLVLLELGFGGVYTDAELARGWIAEAFAAADALIAAIPDLTRRRVPSAGLRINVSTVRRSSWQAGAAGGEGSWRDVLAAACAWATGDAPFDPVMRPGDAPFAPVRPVPEGSIVRPPPLAGVRRVHVCLPDGDPFERAIGRELVLGRHPDAGLRLSHPSVSRRHCRLFERDGACWVEDLGSTQGTQVDGRAIAGPTALAHGARLSLGEVELVYCDVDRPPPSR